MQAGKVSWVGQTFALARCSDSREKKPRNRRTKEERRTMVESFIKKYRNSNNGKFPSLNLTHKEVGGSFYTVREIVRELIQENRVLGPGISTLKALNLEHCLEEHVVGSPSMDPQSHLSMSSIWNAIDQKQTEIHSLTNEHQRISTNCYKINKSITKEASESDPFDISVSQFMHDKSFGHQEQNSNGIYVPGNLVKAEDEDSNSWETSGQMHSDIGVHERIYPEVQGNNIEDYEKEKIEQTVTLCENSYVTSRNGLVVNENDIEKERSSMAGAKSSSAESNTVSKIEVADILPETSIIVNSIASNISDRVQDDSVPYAVEVFPVSSPTAMTCDSDRLFRETESINSSEVASGVYDSSNEVEVASMPFCKDPITNRMELTEIPSSIAINEAATGLTSPISQSLRASTSEITRVELQPVLQPNHMEKIINDNTSVCGESLSPAVHEPPNFSSVSVEKADEKSEMPEVNPVWAAVTAFIAAVVKFWTE